MRIVKLFFIFIFVFQSYAQVSDFESINFEKADSIAVSYKNEKLNNLPDLAYKLTAGLNTDVERFRSLFKWVSTNLSNDYGLYHKNKRKRLRYKNDSIKLEAWNDTFKAVIFRKMLKNKRTICTGYAYILKELSNLADLNCRIVHGFGKTSATLVDSETDPNHSWNAIQLNGKWYLADPTWASGIPNPETNKFQFYFNEGYFLTNPELFAVNHYPIEDQWSLLENRGPSFEDFINAPIIYGNAYIYLNAIKFPKKMYTTIKKNEKVSFEYHIGKPLNKSQISFMIDSGDNTKKTIPQNTTINEKSLNLEYEFNKSGLYDLHLLIDEKLISTYTFRVKG